MMSASTYRFADVTVDRENLRVIRSGAVCPLEPKSFKALVYLIENRHRVVSKEDLVRAISPNAFVTDNALTRTIAQIRKALNDDARQARVIQTVPTVGYRFIADLTEGTPETAPPPASHKSRAALVMLGAVGLLAVIGWGALLRHEGAAEGGVPAFRSVQFSKGAGLDITPAFSSDGTLIAYSSDKTGGFQIYVRSRDQESRELRITDNGQQNMQPAFSPDGTSIVYASVKGGIFRVPSLGGPARKLSDFGSYPVWSPDGNTIAFQSSGIGTMSATDTYFLVNSNIWTVPAAGGVPSQITSPANLPGSQHFPSWNPNGHEIRFVNCTSPGCAMWEVDPSGGAPRKLFDSPPGGFGRATFSADRKALYYIQSNVNGDIRLQRLPLDPVTAKPNGPPVTLYRPSLGVPRDFAISPDGRQMAFSVVLSRSEVISQRLDSRKLTPVGDPVSLTTEIEFRYSHPAFSPDGRLLAYTSWPKGGFGGVWVAHADGTDAKLISPGSSSYFSPEFNPDGKSVRYFGAGKHQEVAIETTLADGKSQVRTTLPWTAASQTFSPDGKEIAYNEFSNEVVQVWKLNVATGEKKQMTFGPVSQGWARYSPNGKWLALEVQPVGRSHLAIMPASGGAPKIIYDRAVLAFCNSWTADGDKIIFTALEDGAWNVYWLSISTRQVERLTNYRSIRSYVRYPVISPASDQVAFEFNESKGNIFIAAL